MVKCVVSIKEKNSLDKYLYYQNLFLIGEVMKKKWEYVIKVDDKIVWRGMNPKEKFKEIKKKNPNKKVSIAWLTHEDVLVCL